MTMTIFGLALGIGTIQYRNFNSQQKIKNAIADMVNNLRLTQGRANAGDRQGVSAVGCPTLLGYQVSRKDLKTYQVQPYCNTGAASLFTDYPLPEGIVFDANFTPFRFLTAGKGVNVASSIRIRDQNGTSCYTVAVSTSGDIVSSSGGSCLTAMVIKNEATGLSCDAICNANDGRTCADVGTDGNATNNCRQVYSLITSSCTDQQCGDTAACPTCTICSSVIADQNVGGFFCGNGMRARWTNCNCVP